jgi:hypothetical protein
MKAVAECHKLHANPVFDETVYVNDNQTLKNVVVHVSGGLPEGESYPKPTRAAVLDQRGCMYEPHVLGVMVGQALLIRSDDPFLHNVHSLAEQNPAFNFGQPNRDPGRGVEPMKVPETFKVKCDVHPWMGAWVAVFDHPYFSVTNDQGTFAIPALPPGKYTLTAWHESLGEQKQDVTVEEGKPLELEFSFGSK